MQVASWVTFPGLVAFEGIGQSSGRRGWPSWGLNLCNLLHAMLLWGARFLAIWAAFVSRCWPILGWLCHISIDLTGGYALRARPQG